MGKYLVFQDGKGDFKDGKKYEVTNEDDNIYEIESNTLLKKSAMYYTYTVHNDYQSGGRNDYYTAQVRVQINGEWQTVPVTFDEYAKALRMMPEEYNIGKEIHRLANGRLGNGKEGNTELRGAEKIVYYANKKLEWVKEGFYE